MSALARLRDRARTVAATMRSDLESVVERDPEVEDLVVVGAGDPTLDDWDGAATAQFTAWASALRAAGIELLPLYKCLALLDRKEPWRLREEWFAVGEPHADSPSRFALVSRPARRYGSPPVHPVPLSAGPPETR